MRRLPVSVLCLLVLFLGLLSAPAQGAQHTEAGQRLLVLIGAPGLTWDDISPLSTPALWARLDEAAIGVMTVRSVRARACAADGWLTLGAGRRAADSPSETGCRPRTRRRRSAARWPGYLEAAATDGFDAQLGLLAGVATDANVPDGGRAGAGSPPPMPAVSWPHRRRSAQFTSSTPGCCRRRSRIAPPR